LVAALAFGLRFLAIDLTPLQGRESQLAMSAWRIAQGEGVSVAGNPLLIYVNALLFFLFGATDGIARAAPALVGAFGALLQVFFRRQLGRYGALSAGALLATSPSLVLASRNVDGVALVAGLGLALIALFQAYRESRALSTLCIGAAGLALLLMAGPSAF